MHKSKVYIAGPIKGVLDYKERFAEAERDFSEHYEVLNPARILEGMEDRDCMAICLHLIDMADSVILLPGWRSSLGANIEAAYAIRQGKIVVAYKNKGSAYSVSWDGHRLTGGEE